MKYWSTQREEVTMQSKWTNLRNVLDVQINILRVRSTSCQVRAVNSSQWHYYVCDPQIPTTVAQLRFLNVAQSATFLVVEQFEQISVCT